MKLIVAFLRLVRLPNLFFIALAQFLFQRCIVDPVFRNAAATPVLSNMMLGLLIGSSVLIAAAGYIINDYFDIDIDEINKPKANVVDRVISRRWAMLWHSLLSFIGVAIGFLVGWKTGVFWIGFMNLICSLSLFIYSTSLKKKLLSGNILISLLTAWVIAVIGLASFYEVFNNPGSFPDLAANRILRITILYSCFSFIISLVREVVKDMEDREGDAKYGGQTIPIRWGLNAAKVFTAVWSVVLIGLVVVLQVYVLVNGWWWTVAYSVPFILAPMLYFLLQLYRATRPQEFHRLSTVAKFVMLTGIISMIFFQLYL